MNLYLPSSFRQKAAADTPEHFCSSRLWSCMQEYPWICQGSSFRLKASDTVENLSCLALVPDSEVVIWKTWARGPDSQRGFEIMERRPKDIHSIPCSTFLLCFEIDAHFYLRKEKYLAGDFPQFGNFSVWLTFSTTTSKSCKISSIQCQVPWTQFSDLYWTWYCFLPPSSRF